MPEKEAKKSEAKVTRRKSDTVPGSEVEKSILYIGIDLGTSKASITASDGVRTTVRSLIGWPKDAVAKKHLKKSVLFGDEVLENRLALDWVRPFEKGMIKYSDGAPEGVSKKQIEKCHLAAKELVKYLISLAEPRKGDLVYGVLGTPAQASVINKQALIDAAKESLDAVMIVSEPFAVAYGLERYDGTFVVDIGAGTVDLCRMHGSLPEKGDQVTLPTAGDHIDELLYQLIRKKHPEAQLTLNMARLIKEKYGFAPNVSEAAKVRLTVEGKPTVIDLTEVVHKACSAIVPHIVEAVQKLVATFDPEFQEKLRNNILLAGGGSKLKGLDVVIEEALVEYGGGKVMRVEEPVFAGANGALKLAFDMPDEYWKSML